MAGLRSFLGSFLFGSRGFCVALLETLHSPTGVHQFLCTSEKWVAFRAQFHSELGNSASSHEGVPAGTGDGCLEILWMNAGFHGFPILGDRSSPAFWLIWLDKWLGPYELLNILGFVVVPSISKKYNSSLMASFGTAQLDPYEVLGVPSNASSTVIRAAYRAIAKMNHPDTNPGNTTAEARMKAAAAAYATIGHPEKRNEYDQAYPTPQTPKPSTKPVSPNDFATTFWEGARPAAQASRPDPFGMFDVWGPEPLWNAKPRRFVKDVHEA